MKGEGGSSRWHWTLIIVFLLGMLSLMMLVWVDRLSQRQRMHFARADAVMDIRIHAATSHLWLEEVIAHKVKGTEKVWADLARAVRLSRALLDGGKDESGMIVEPIEPPEARRLAEGIQQLLGEFEKSTREILAKPELAGVGSPLEDRNNEIFIELQRHAGELERSVKAYQAADFVSSKRLILGISLAWSVFVAASAMVLVLLERQRRRAEAAVQTSRDELEERVAERTKELRSLNVRLYQELGERQKAEGSLQESQEQLRTLSARLLTAQETERRRISAELHDHLGNALMLLKLRLREARRECPAESGGSQTVPVEECQKLSRFIDQIMEDVRRISRDLSPSVLEDMGLSAALRWLVDNHVGNPGLEVVPSIADVDHFLPPSAHIHVYRIMQEALTNATKHAQANRVRLIVKRHADWLSFVVEDDGKGFDPKSTTMRDGSPRGLGLATMDERARMVGGSLTVRSAVVRGTRISLAVPMQDSGGG